MDFAQDILYTQRLFAVLTNDLTEPNVALITAFSIIENIYGFRFSLPTVSTYRSSLGETYEATLAIHRKHRRPIDIFILA